MAEIESRDMHWWVEQGLDDLVSRVEIAARLEWLLDYYREQQPANEGAEDALLDALDILCGFVSPRLQLKQRWPKPQRSQPLPAPSAIETFCPLAPLAEQDDVAEVDVAPLDEDGAA